MRRALWFTTVAYGSSVSSYWHFQSPEKVHGKAQFAGNGRALAKAATLPWAFSLSGASQGPSALHGFVALCLRPRASSWPWQFAESTNKSETLNFAHRISCGRGCRGAGRGGWARHRRRGHGGWLAPRWRGRCSGVAAIGCAVVPVGYAIAVTIAVAAVGNVRRHRGPSGRTPCASVRRVQSTGERGSGSQGAP